MKRFYIFGFLVLLLFDTIAQIGFKFAAEAAEPAGLDGQWLMRIVTEKWVYVAVGCYLGAFGTWMTILQHAPVGPAFATTHLDIVSVLLVSVVFLGETLSFPQIVGAILILAGIGVLATTKSDEPELGSQREDSV